MSDKASESWRRQLLDMWKLKSMHCSFNINIRMSTLPKHQVQKRSYPSFLKNQ